MTSSDRAGPANVSSHCTTTAPQCGNISTFLPPSIAREGPPTRGAVRDTSWRTTTSWACVRRCVNIFDLPPQTYLTGGHTDIGLIFHLLPSQVCCCCCTGEAATDNSPLVNGYTQVSASLLESSRQPTSKVLFDLCPLTIIRLDLMNG